MINLTISKKETEILKKLVGSKVLKIRHDSFDKFEEEAVYGRVELFFKESIILIEYDYAPYNLFGSNDDEHPKFSIKTIVEDEAISTLADSKQIDIYCNKTLMSISLVEDFVEVEWDGKNDSVNVLKAIVFKLEDEEIAFQGDYMIPIIDIIKGDNVIAKLIEPGDEFANDHETKFKAQRNINVL